MRFEYPRNVRFKCHRCAICCGDTEEKIRNILLMSLEADRISRKTMKPIAEFADRTEGSELYIYRMKKTKNGKCVFLEHDLCGIYRERPLVCRFYPFELKARGTRCYTFVYTLECPYIAHGPELGREYFEKLARSADLIRKAKFCKK